MNKVRHNSNMFVQYAGLFKAGWHYADKRRYQIVLFYAMSMIANIIMMAQPLVVGQVINVLQQGGPDVMPSVSVWLAAYAGVIILYWCFHGPSRVIERQMAFHVKSGFYQQIYSRLVGLPLSWHHDNHSGNVINRVNKAGSALYSFSGNQFSCIATAVNYILITAVLAWLSWPVAVGMVVISWVMFFTLTRIDRKTMEHIHATNEKEHVFSSRLIDYMNNMFSVISFNLSQSSKGMLKKDLAAILPHVKSQSILLEAKWCINMCVSALMSFALLLFYIGWHHRNGETVLLGNVVAIFQYLLQMHMVFSSVAGVYQQLAQQHTDMNAIDPIHRDYKISGMEEKNGKPLHVSSGKIELQNISFSYAESHFVFQDFSLVIDAGEKIGLVGSSGAGKTTLVQILLRFYNPQKGDVMIDGQNIRDVSTESLRRNIAVIPQDISLFENSVLENIRIAHPAADMQAIIQASEFAGAHDFIMTLPQGYETQVGERGVKLSGGQRQRIAIARAFLKAAPILVLDEATSALDSVTENDIKNAWNDVMNGRTTIVIAHRLSTLRQMDRILVLDQGKIVEQGTHDQLLSLNSRYAAMWAMQAGGFLPERETDGLSQTA